MDIYLLFTPHFCKIIGRELCSRRKEGEELEVVEGRAEGNEKGVEQGEDNGKDNGNDVRRGEARVGISWLS